MESKEVFEKARKGQMVSEFRIFMFVPCINDD